MEKELEEKTKAIKILEVIENFWSIRIFKERIFQHGGWNVTTAIIKPQTNAISQSYSAIVKPTESASIDVATPCTINALKLTFAQHAHVSPP